MLKNYTKTIKMKLLLLMAIPFIGLSQSNQKTLLGVGIQAGYSTKKAPVAEAYLALKKSNVIFYPVSIKIHGTMGDPTIPVIIESRVGYKLGMFEPYFGYGYHKSGQDRKVQYNQYSGFYPSIGLISHIYQKIILSAGLSRFDKNKIFTVQVGVFDFERLKK